MELHSLQQHSCSRDVTQLPLDGSAIQVDVSKHTSELPRLQKSLWSDAPTQLSAGSRTDLAWSSGRGTPTAALSATLAHRIYTKLMRRNSSRHPTVAAFNSSNARFGLAFGSAMATYCTSHNSRFQKEFRNLIAGARTCRSRLD